MAEDTRAAITAAHRYLDAHDVTGTVTTTGTTVTVAVTTSTPTIFLGDNQLGRPLYDATTGGCRDGLHVDRVNQNQGAESTLSCQLALAELRLATRAIAGTA